MTDPIDGYTPQAVYAAFRRQAWRVWAVGAFVVALWMIAIVGAPVAKAFGLDAVSAPIYKFFGYLCHQMTERSFHLEGEKLGVCSRCFGVYSGIFIGFLAYPFWRRIDEIEPVRRFWLFAALIPIGVDWSLGIFDIWNNTQLSRVTTGLILGFACAVFIVPATVEITRNLTSRRIAAKYRSIGTTL